MPDEQPTPDPQEQWRIIERDILYLLTDPTQQTLWSAEELGRELENPNDVADALLSLDRAGLIHRIDNYVFATRQAFYLIKMVGRII
jgi:hypothetical protein